jgi:hypothetical protein
MHGQSRWVHLVNSYEPASGTGRRKKPAKPPADSEKLASSSDSGTTDQQDSYSSSERTAKAPAQSVSGKGDALSSLDDSVDEINEKAKEAVQETVEKSSERVGSVTEPVGEEKPGPGEKDNAPSDAEYEEIELPDESSEDAWAEVYEEGMEEEPSPRRAKKRSHTGSIIAMFIVLLFLLLWTMLAPSVLSETQTTYKTWEPNLYLGQYEGSRNLWAGNMTWGVAIRGPSVASVGTAIDFSVLVTKVSERPSSWFVRGTSLSLRNASVYVHDANDTYLGSASDWRVTDLGLLATVPIAFDHPGEFDLYLYVKFLVVVDMRIGFLPLNAVQVPQIDFDVPIIVS